MNRTLVVLIGTIVLGVLAWLCVSRTAPIVENDLATRAKEALMAHDMDWVDVTADGRTLALNGVAPDAQTRVRASEIAELIWGAYAVNNDLSIGSRSDAEQSTDPSGLGIKETADARQPDDPFAVGQPDSSGNGVPYRLNITREGQSIGLVGTVPDRDTRDALINIAKVQYPEASVDDQLRIQAGAPEGWRTAVENILTNLDKFEVAEAVLVDGKVTVNGRLQATVDRGTVQQTITRKLPDDYTLEFLVVAPEPIKLSSDQCRMKFADEISEQVITFETNSSRIAFEEVELIGRLIEFRAQCPGSRIQVAGHTDARGGPEINKRLSEARANALIKYLKSKGVSDERLSAVGFGEERPIADNSSGSGQASNRRIEFIYQGD